MSLARTTRDGASEEAWGGYLRNVGVYVGKRAMCDGRGTVIADFPTRVEARRFRESNNPRDEFVLWRTYVRTVDKVDHADEEWSRDELGSLGALAADGSFSVGPSALGGEQFSVEQCICEGELRVRSIHAYDWEGMQCGIVASREKVLEGASLRPDGANDPDETVFSNSQDGDGIAPAAWSNPQILLDYIQGKWSGKGVLLDRISGRTRLVQSRLSLVQGDGAVFRQKSALVFANSDAGSEVISVARLDGNVLFFPDSNVQLVLLPGGMAVAGPVRLPTGTSFVVETTFLIRPDRRKRVVRCYDCDRDWINTVFLTEVRVG